MEDQIEVIAEDDERLTPFQTSQLIAHWAKSNNLQLPVDGYNLLLENRRPPTGNRKPNIPKWGALPCFRNSRRRVSYERREVLRWLERNRHNFKPLS